MFVDEAISLSSSSFSFIQMIKWYSSFGETHPIWFDFIFGRLSLWFTSEIFLRSIVFIFNILSFLIYYLYAKELNLKKSLSLFLVLLLVTHPEILSWNNLIRSYFLQFFFFGIILFARVKEKNLLYKTSMILFGQLHFFSLITALLATLFEKRQILKTKEKIFILSTLIPNLIYFSYVLFFAKDPTRLIIHYPKMDLSFLQNFSLTYFSINFTFILFLFGLLLVVKENLSNYRESLYYLFNKHLIESISLITFVLFVLIGLITNKSLVTSYNMIFLIPSIYILIIKSLNKIPYIAFAISLIMILNFNKFNSKINDPLVINHYPFEAMKIASKIEGDQKVLLFCFKGPIFRTYQFLNRFYKLKLNSRIINECDNEKASEIINTKSSLVWIHNHYREDFVKMNKKFFTKSGYNYLYRP